MFDDLSDLRESLFAARLLREEILAHPVPPSGAARLRASFLAENAPGRSRAAVETALRRAESAALVVERATLEEIAAAAGGAGLRMHPGAPFHGKAAPHAARTAELLEEMLETVNAPVAVETWPAPVRAFGLHFLLRLVQPFEAPADVVGHAAELMLLAVDGFVADRMLLAEPEIGAEGGPGRPDPDAFVRARTHRLVERLGETRDRVRDAAGRALLAAWAASRESRLNRRQAHLIRLLAQSEPPRPFTFQDYVDLHAGRRAPSLRSLQRDFHGLRERGLLRLEDGAWTIDLGALTLGAVLEAGRPA